MKSPTGRIIFQDQPILNLPPQKIVDMGIVQVPEGAKSFPYMTVKENLLLGAYGAIPGKKEMQTL